MRFKMRTTFYRYGKDMNGITLLSYRSYDFDFFRNGRGLNEGEWVNYDITEEQDKTILKILKNRSYENRTNLDFLREYKKYYPNQL